MKLLKRFFRKNPVVIINFKTYKQGEQVLRLAKQIEQVDKNIIIGLPSSEISGVRNKTRLTIFAQHVDYQQLGRNTGFIMPEAVKSHGAKGVFLNHSEHPLSMSIIKKTVERCKGLNLKTAVFAKDLKEAKKIQKLKPTFIIFEPPELVAGKVSVSRAKPKKILEISKYLKSGFLVGAGIKNREDVKTALKLGASGIAVSSVIIKAKDPKNKLKELLKD